jgi:hypothetical protein
MGYIYQLLFHHSNLQSYFLNFTQTHVDFTGTGVGLPFSSNKTSSYFFAKIIFRSATFHFFIKLLPLKQKVHFPFSEYQNRVFNFPNSSFLQNMLKFMFLNFPNN